ncbi:MAG TPA: DUF1553 domain-containing protein, partial [Pirellulales bacterium]|nr:DUF1553 domain-containing protein [Pirellulales bacterium]
RLEAEVVRDAVLATAGKLNEKLCGTPVPVMEDDVGQIVVGIENLNGENRPGEIIPLNGEEFRRSLYVQVRRTRPLAVLDAFDLPVMEPNCDCRTHSTVAGQSLMLMNSEFMLALAVHFAERVAAEAGADPRNQVAHAWRLAFATEPAEVEITAALRFMADQTEQLRANQAEPKPADGVTAKPSPQRQALSCFCQALLSSNAFLYME